MQVSEPPLLLPIPPEPGFVVEPPLLQQQLELYKVGIAFELPGGL